MCGIAGIAGRPGLDPQRGETVRRMAATLVHRGPDGEDLARRDGCDLGFRRLAIVDVASPAQIMADEERAVWSVCNGEIYNSAALRERLASRGHRFRTAIDTEVLPHLYEEMGEDLLDELDGMFAFALWDERRRILLLGRDRAGEKPLFWCERGDGSLAFSSELRALVAALPAPPRLDPIGLRRYLLHDFFPAPRTPFAGIHKLPAGHLLVRKDGMTRIRRYWDLASYYTGGGPVPPMQALAAELDVRLGTAVARRRQSDGPVGVFLSGGLDSSIVLAHLASQVGQGVPVFSLGHRDPAFDESRFARVTAARFGADYEEVVLDEADLEDGLRRVAAGFDEPLGDASTIPTHLLALAARRKVKVVLSGEGGDELFAGYPTYLGDRLATAWARVPAALRAPLRAAVVRLAPEGRGDVGIPYLLRRFLEGAERGRIERHHGWFGSFGPLRQEALLSAPLREALAGDDPFAAARAALDGHRFPDALASLLYDDFVLYLQDDLLTKVDRATMLASLEARAPFLDHELAQFAAGLPSSAKLSGLTTKKVLRLAAAKRLPREVLTRRKRGFNIPFARWMRGALGPRVVARFSPERVAARGLFRPEAVTVLIDEHLSRRADHRKPLFTLLALDLWCDRTWGEGAAVPLADPLPLSQAVAG
ncbi:MAG TPA: asparagine synthase (glutamine-hydrolyzing) [Candidatus Polarisedimenticolaceae bacterium]|nr:asparagine synthase (glutamine-hydrolyzing) [Candidatus Polarisedimenticolaceae bacterium]